MIESHSCPWTLCSARLTSSSLHSPSMIQSLVCSYCALGIVVIGPTIPRGGRVGINGRCLKVLEPLGEIFSTGQF